MSAAPEGPAPTRAVVRGARLQSRRLTTSRTLSGLPSSAGERMT
jgi:hypothetical protein